MKNLFKKIYNALSQKVVKQTESQSGLEPSSDQTLAQAKGANDMGNQVEEETKMDKKYGSGPINPDFVLVQDAENLHSSMQDVTQLISKETKNSNIRYSRFEFGSDLREFFESEDSKNGFLPRAFFLDCGGAGSDLGQDIIKWYQVNHPDTDLPEIHFLSLSTSMGINEAARLKISHPNITTGFVSEGELRSTQKYLQSSGDDIKDTYGGLPDTKDLRLTLQKLFGIELPEDVDEKAFLRNSFEYERYMRSDVISSYKKGLISPLEVIEKLEPFAKGITEGLQGGLYKLQRDDIEGDAAYYTGTGTPVKGPAVFSKEEAENWSSSNGSERPILVMQNYDPGVVELLSSGKIAGIVLNSTYLAAHLAFLCDANKISGVFGLPPEGASTRLENFNELAKVELPPYYEGDEVKINGKTLCKGDNILIGVGKNAIAFTEEKVKELGEVLETLKSEEVSEGMFCEKIYSNDFQVFMECFQKVFNEYGIATHQVKANVDNPNNWNLTYAQGIGLVRTEQVAAMDLGYANALRQTILEGGNDNYKHLEKWMKDSYNEIIFKIDKNYPVKMRLFDLSPKELFEKEEQTLFHQKYGRLDINGMIGVELFPRLYETQIDEIFKAFKTSYRSQADTPPLQIMMPAVRNEEETQKIKAMVEQGAKNNDIPLNRLQFGVMIETDDSCNNAESILKHCDFISFGTNDLTQQVLGVPRDDLKARAKYSQDNGFDPYKKIAPEVMDKVRHVCKVARLIKPDMEVDICGGQAADIEMAKELFSIGINNISVAPSIKNLMGLNLELKYEAAQNIIHNKIPPVLSQTTSYQAKSNQKATAGL